MSQKTLAYPEREVALVLAAIKSPAVYDTAVAAGLLAEHVTQPPVAAIWAVVVECYEAGGEVRGAVMVERLRQLGKHDACKDYANMVHRCCSLDASSGERFTCRAWTRPSSPPSSRSMVGIRDPSQQGVQKGALDAPSKHPQRWRHGHPISARRSDGTLYKRGASGRAVNDGITRRGTLWDYGDVGHGHSGDQDLEATGHPARFPTRLANDVVRCFSPLGGLVCDPFVGSGTTALSAAKNGRRFVGGDLGARERDGRRWADIARERAMEIVDPAQQRLF